MTRKKLATLLLGATLAAGLAAPATAQWAVFDGANYV